VSGSLVALTLLQPDAEPGVIPPSPLSDGDLVLVAGLVILIGVIFGVDLFRTWWDTNQWRREARRRRRELR
jgi:hypothetical protein